MTEVNRPPRPGGWTRFVTARPRLSLLVALVLTALAVVAGSDVADRLGSGGWEDPAAQSTYATKALEREFPDSQPNFLLLVDAGETSVDAPAVAAEAKELTERLTAEKGVTGVGSYWLTGAPTLRSEDGTEALIAARLTGDDTAVNKTLDRIAPELRGTHGPVEVKVGGILAVRHEMQTTIQEDLLRAEMIALPVTLVLLVMVFGSAVAALLPLGVGIVAILGTNAILRGLTEVTDVSVFALNLTTAMGLGLAIDYALFIVRRFREELSTGADSLTAVATTLRTAGRTVLFSALTVAVSLAAMMVFPQYFLKSFAYAGIAVVLLAAAAALILLPAALVLLGDRVNALDLRKLFKRRGPKTGDGSPAKEEGAAWGRTAALVMRRAPYFAVATTAGLLLLGLPFLGVRFGTADDRQLPSTAESHVVQQHLREGFPGTPGGGLSVLAEGEATKAEYAAYKERLADLPEALRVEGPLVEGDWAYFTVQPKGEAVDEGAQHLVEEIRATDAPFDTSVTGTAAVLVDTKAAIGDGLPWALSFIVIVTLILVFLLTGSVLIPLQAVLLNALSLTAMFGALVWVFQDGHLSGLLAFTSPGSIETTLPVLMFCVAFGLSMDYGVFLLSRIKEEYDHTGDHTASVRFGLQRTGGLITAAAVILAVVMVAIGTSRVTNTKMLGLGIALAVLMDAMVIRSLLVPAVMRLTGRATWWAPPPLRRFHNRFGLTEAAPPKPTPTPQPEPEPVATHSAP
ncbi:MULTISPECIES: MMPL family transporter [Streptomyces]|uniref:MMPL family transporter n=1 Tax=Streptomyces caniscabiei TaxID=2746961 RepID=A0ABU4MWS6_9ACTN|nr:MULTISPECIES: MMPL family transporter [Streptomyces]MBE4739465.1 MMPL family transporter [Streptomyces caniscabiei]MBE4759987.1 MMPL family transporter [Streptomyces caniscabiei]MBE4772671.1 MMPL family transporter [Streptomyces caniscabiei]MBE4784601.1 MMPL family transporter [Streptomyces caniscabiei]MBE4798155.1 MMPL family transporter [Streptomyces caniscabiei]